ncbi:HNH endonuclease, partial [Arthrobacter sp. 2MCAF14]
NGAGLCEACNHTKELKGWTARTEAATTRPGTRHVLDIRTPTGHHYRSTAPPLPGAGIQGTDPPDTGLNPRPCRRKLRRQAKALRYAHVTELRAAA